MGISGIHTATEEPWISDAIAGQPIKAPTAASLHGDIPTFGTVFVLLKATEPLARARRH
jgi:hypothetical protein